MGALDDFLNQTGGETPAAAPSPDSPLEQFLTGESDARKLGLAAQFGASKDAQRSARILRLQTKTGLPQDYVDRNLDVVEKQAAIEGFDPEAFKRASPSVASWLAEHPDHFATAKDDYHRLSGLERTLNALAQGWEHTKQIGAAWSLGAAVRPLAKLHEFENRVRQGEQPADMHDFADPHGFKSMTADDLQAFRERMNADLIESAKTIARQQVETLKRPFDPVIAEGQRAADEFRFGDFWHWFTQKPFEYTMIMGAQSAAPSAVALAAAVPAGFLGGTPAALAAIFPGSFAVDYGATVLQAMEDEGVDLKNPESVWLATHDQALMGRVGAQAFGHAIAVASLDVVSGGVAGRTLGTAGTRAARPIVKQGVNVALQAPVQGTLGATGEALGEAAAGQKVQPGQILAEFMGEFAFSPAEVAGMGVAGAKDRYREALAARERGAFFEALGAGVSESKTYERLPEALQEIVARATKDGPIETLYMPADAFSTYFQGQGVDPRAIAQELGIAPQDYEQAVQAGYDLAIPTSRYAVKIAPTIHNAFFAQEIRTAPETMNAREAEAWYQQVVAESKAAAEKESEQVVQDEQDRSAMAVSREIQGQLVAMGYDPGVVEQYAQLFESRYRTRAERRGLGEQPMDLYAQQNLHVTREMSDVLKTLGGDVTELDALLDRIRAGEQPAQKKMYGASLFDMLREAGGVQDQGGELSAMGIDDQRKPFQRNVVNPEGLTLERATERAVEGGYLAEQDINAFLDLLSKEAHGEPAYSANEENAQAVGTAQAMEALQHFLDERGIDLASVDNETVKQALVAANVPVTEVDLNAEPMFQDGSAVIVDGISRPTHNSEGQPIAKTKAAMSAFWRWFGDSKVVDEHGRPQVVYHGTAHDIEQFTNVVIWFTPDTGTAKTYADRAAYVGLEIDEEVNVDEVPASKIRAAVQGGAGQTIYPVYLRLEHPLDLSELGHTPEPQEVFRHLQSLGFAKGQEFADWENDLTRDQPTLWKMIEDWGLHRDFQTHGYDGFIIDDVATTGAGHVAYAVFNPMQVKSALHNSGAFSPEDPRIFYQSERVPVPAFYPKSLVVLDQKMGGSAPAADIKKMLLNNGVKADELKWTGLDDFLAKKAKVTKAEVLDFIQKNSPTVVPVVLGEGQFDEATFRRKNAGDLEELRKLGWSMEFNPEDPGRSAFMEIDPQTGQPVTDADFVDADDIPVGTETEVGPYAGDPGAARQIAESLQRRAEYDSAKVGATKHQQWQAVKGGTNYREVLLTWPSRTHTIYQVAIEGVWHSFNTIEERNVAFKSSGLKPGNEQMREIQSGSPAVRPEDVQIRKSGTAWLVSRPGSDLVTSMPVRWVQPDGPDLVLDEPAARRMAAQFFNETPETDRLPPDYKIESLRDPRGLGRKWTLVHPDGSGYALTSGTYDEAHAEAVKYLRGQGVMQMPVEDYFGGHYGEIPNVIGNLRMSDFVVGGKKVRMIQEVQDDLQIKIRRLKEQIADRATAGHKPTDEQAAELAKLESILPFRGNSFELAMRQALRMAAEDRMDVLAWATGKQSVDVYNLRKQVRSVKVRLMKDGLYQVTAEANDGRTVDVGTFPSGEKLEEAIGKDLAGKVAEDFKTPATEPAVALTEEQMAESWGGRIAEFTTRVDGQNWGVTWSDDSTSSYATEAQARSAVRHEYNDARPLAPVRSTAGWTAMQHNAEMFPNEWRVHVPEDEASYPVTAGNADQAKAKVAEILRRPSRQKNNERTYSGVQLEVGGEWAVKLYDQMIPRYLEKYGKKWGVQVGETTLQPASKPAVSVGHQDYLRIVDGGEEAGVERFQVFDQEGLQGNDPPMAEFATREEAEAFVTDTLAGLTVHRAGGGAAPELPEFWAIEANDGAELAGFETEAEAQAELARIQAGPPALKPTLRPMTEGEWGGYAGAEAFPATAQNQAGPHPLIGEVRMSLHGEPVDVEIVVDSMGISFVLIDEDTDGSQPREVRIPATAFDAPEFLTPDYAKAMVTILFNNPQDPHWARLVAVQGTNLEGLRPLRGEVTKRTVVHSIPVTDAMRQSVLYEGQPLFQKGMGPDAKASITFGAGRIDIRLLEWADLSSLIHEMGHLYLKELVTDATTAGTSDQLRTDLDTILKWGGSAVRVADGLEAVRGALTTELHELFARGFEAYTLEGKAPSTALREVFAHFRQWLIQVYRLLTFQGGPSKEQIGKALNVKLTDEVRAVMSRLEATEAEIEQAEKDADVRPLFATPESANMTAAEFEVYKTTIAQAGQQARETLEGRMMAQLRREQERWWKEQRGTVQAEVSAEVNAQPVYVALAAMQKGLLPDGTPLPDGLRPVKLDQNALVDEFGKDFVKRLPRGIRSADGVRPDAAAVMFGFGTGQELVMALINARPRRQLIEAETDRRMQQEHGDLRFDGSAAEMARAAVANEAREQVLEMEIKALHRKQREVAPFVKQAKAEAKDKAREGRAVLAVMRPSLDAVRRTARSMIGRKVVRMIKPYEFWVAARRASQEAATALGKDQYVEAGMAKTREMMNLALFREASAAKDEVQAIYDHMVALRKKPAQERLGKAGADYRDQINELMNRYEFANVPVRVLESRRSLAEWIAEKEENGETLGEELAVPESVKHESRRVNYKQVTYEELLGIRDTVRQIEHFAKLKNRLLKAQGKREKDELRESLIAAIGANLTDKGPPPLTAAGLTSMQKASRMAQQFDVSLMKTEQIVEWLDGGPTGPWHDALWNPAVDAQAAEYDYTDNITAKLAEMVAGLPASIRDRMLDPIQVAGIEAVVTRKDILGVALNVGNQGNYDKLIKGMAWDPEQVTAMLDHLTQEEWTFVQGVWDLLETMKPDIWALQKRLTGMEPVAVEPRAVQTKYGTFRGGYYPIMYDPVLSKQGQVQLSDTIGSIQNQAKATLASGYRKARVEGFARPFNLNIDHLPSHFASVIKDLTHREWLYDARWITEDPAIRKALQRHLGDAATLRLGEWVTQVVNDRNVASMASLNIWHRMVEHLRYNTMIAAMGFKFSTLLSQVAGLAPAIEVIGDKAGDGARWFGVGVAEWLRRPRSSYEFVKAKSGEMRHRLMTRDRDMRDKLRELEGQKGHWAEIQSASLQAIGYMELSISIPSWLGAYYKALDEGLSDETAVRMGDRAVRLGQGAAGAKDLSAVAARNEQLMRILTMFYTPFSAEYNRLRAIGHDFGGLTDVPMTMYRLFLTVIVAGTIGAFASGHGPDDKKDETWTAWWLKNMAIYPFLGIPIAREAVNAIAQGYGYTFTPIAQALETTIQSVRLAEKVATGEKEWTAFADKAVKAFSYLFGAPTGQVMITGTYLVDLLTGKAHPDDIFQFTHDLWYKRPKDER